MRGKYIFTLALGLFLALLFATQTTTTCEAGNGACFHLPEGSWELGPRGYHNGCEGTGVACGPIMGYDYLAPKGTEIYAPFSGRVILACAHDGVGNTVFRLQSDDGKWEYGDLHLRCAVTGNQHVKAGDVIGYVDAIGWANGIPHTHTWFRNLETGENVRDHSQFWSCLGDEPEDPEPPDPEDPEPEKSLWQKILEWFRSEPQKFLSSTLEWLTGMFKTGSVSDPAEPEIRKFSISAQQPGNSGYQHNIRAFFAWPTSGYDLAKFSEIDLENFEGNTMLKPGELTSVNSIFGTKGYEEGQGMVVPSGFKIGDGACNAASMVAYTVAAAGLTAKCDNPSHPKIPGVPSEWNCTVCIPSESYGMCTEQDIHLMNTTDHPVYLHWKISGDNLYLWIREEVVTGPIEIDWSKVAVLGGILVVIIVIIIFIARRRPDIPGEIFIRVSEHSGFWKQIFHEAFRLAWSWSILILTSAFVLSSTLREMVRIGFSKWIENNTSIANWQIVALFLSLLLNLVVRKIKRRQPTENLYHISPDGRKIRKKTLDGRPIRSRRKKTFLPWLLIGGIVIGGTVFWFNTLNPNFVTYAGLYGHLGPGGWGSLSEVSTAEQAVETVRKYANQVDTFNGARLVVPVVNLVHLNEDDATIQSVITACRWECVVMIDISPEEDVSSVISRWTQEAHVWFDIDLEQGSVDASKINMWANEYFGLRLKRGLLTRGVFAFYDFKSDPQVQPNKIRWQYLNGLVVPIFDGHCSGESCQTTKWAATKKFLENYAQAKQFGLMEFSTRWGCGSQYGDCGFTLQEYWEAFKPLIFLGQ